jgi:hypothetical protein
MDIRKIIQEELKKVIEGVGNDYYNNFPDFLDTQFNPQMGHYPPKGMHAYGQMVKEDSLDEDYPEMFKMEEFKTLTTFAERIRYCEAFLQRISSGSSRIVYKIDDEKVLKLAKNKKGLAQNEVEIEYSHEDLGEVLATIYDYDPNNLWVEMELARKLKVADFKKITGFNFKDYAAAVHNYGDTANGRGRGHKMEVDEKIVEQMWEDEFVYGIFQYIGNYGIPAGDLIRLSTYGIVKEDGEERVVIIDYGLTSDVYSSYYS